MIKLRISQEGAWITWGAPILISYIVMERQRENRHTYRGDHTEKGRDVTVKVGIGMMRHLATKGQGMPPVDPGDLKLVEAGPNSPPSHQSEPGPDGTLITLGPPN